MIRDQFDIFHLDIHGIAGIHPHGKFLPKIDEIVERLHDLLDEPVVADREQIPSLDRVICAADDERRVRVQFIDLLQDPGNVELIIHQPFLERVHQFHDISRDLERMHDPGAGERQRVLHKSSDGAEARDQFRNGQFAAVQTALSGDVIDRRDDRQPVVVETHIQRDEVRVFHGLDDLISSLEMVPSERYISCPSMIQSVRKFSSSR